MDKNITMVSVDLLRTNRFNQRPVKAIGVKVSDTELVASVCTALKPAIGATSAALDLFNLAKLYYAWRSARRVAPIQTTNRVPSDQPSGYSYFNSRELDKLNTLAERWWYVWADELIDVMTGENCELLADYECGSRAQDLVCRGFQEDWISISASLEELSVTISDDMANEIISVSFGESDEVVKVQLMLGVPSVQLISAFYESYERLGAALPEPECFEMMVQPQYSPSTHPTRVGLVTTPYLMVRRGDMVGYTTGLHEFSPDSTLWDTEDCEGVLNPFGKIDLMKLIIKPGDAEVIETFGDRYSFILEKAVEKYAMAAEILGPDFF